MCVAALRSTQKDSGTSLHYEQYGDPQFSLTLSAINYRDGGMIPRIWNRGGITQAARQEPDVYDVTDQDLSKQ